jgi:hypothetical protein
MKRNKKRRVGLQEFYVVSQLVIKVHRQETLVDQYRRGKREKALVIADSPFRSTIGRDLDIPRVTPVVRRVRLRFVTGQLDRRGCGGGGLDVLFDVLEIEGFDVCGPMFGGILKPMHSSSGGAISYDVSLTDRRSRS